MQISDQVMWKKIFTSIRTAEVAFTMDIRWLLRLFRIRNESNAPKDFWQCAKKMRKFYFCRRITQEETWAFQL